MPHLVATLIYLSQIYSYYIKGDRSPLNKATGSDGFRNELLKYGCKHSATPVATIFNNIFKTGHYPETWKLSFIKPLHKKGDKNYPGYYRGISLQNCISKLFATILNDGLYDYMEVNNTFYEASQVL